MVLSTPKAEITGIFIVKRINGEWRGTIMNEFGIKVLDFVSSPQKCKVLNAVAFLDKWYIKKTIASDLHFMMEPDNSVYATKILRSETQDTLTVSYKKLKQIQRFPNGEIIYKNHKHELTYSLKKIYESER